MPEILYWLQRQHVNRKCSQVSILQVQHNGQDHHIIEVSPWRHREFKKKFVSPFKTIFQYFFLDFLDLKLPINSVQNNEETKVVHSDEKCDKFKSPKIKNEDKAQENNQGGKNLIEIDIELDICLWKIGVLICHKKQFTNFFLEDLAAGFDLPSPFEPRKNFQREYSRLNSIINFTENEKDLKC